MGRTYSRSPSSWFPELGPTAALVLDMEALKLGSETEKREADRQKRMHDARQRLRRGH